jgi:hypothetical protein
LRRYTVGVISIASLVKEDNKVPVPIVPVYFLSGTFVRFG